MNTAHTITVDSAPVTPWRNGGGVTRELLAWPDPADWRLRISVADIAADGPFSAFPGVQRWFVLLSGEGVVLDFDNHGLALRPGDAPLAFDGAAAPGCRLMDGPVRDLNLMLRGGAGGMATVSPGTAWQAPAGAQAGLFARVAGRWHSGDQQRSLPALSLLWFDAPPPGDWCFEADTTAATASQPTGWWLHHILEPASI
ncbi:HutD family protein [Hydrogenophaga aromaticivorans]|uniref:HutD/Ves family protein n=1 Tax=Hydrogenophaga aromaticivorans TaxID=2610898 RepID=UPI001B389D3E|nr:HutD family protein [Hydrogenophaga aromaticivorans]MBQ0922272.1 HutD family protein [Hydrogenophaga aromaticivorans]